MTKEELLAILGDDSKKDAELSKILDFYNNSTTDIKKEEPKKEEPKKEEFKSDTKITATFAEFMQLINKMQEKESPKKKEEDDSDAEIFI